MFFAKIVFVAVLPNSLQYKELHIFHFSEEYRKLPRKNFSDSLNRIVYAFLSCRPYRASRRLGVPCGQIIYRAIETNICEGRIKGRDNQFAIVGSRQGLAKLPRYGRPAVRHRCQVAKVRPHQAWF
jgi:hypothetical protein